MSAILNGIPEERLTLEQEADLAKQEDKTPLVLANLREAFFYARGCHQSRGQDDGEILSACYDGLLSASKNFKPGGLRFFSFAKAHVRGALSKAIRSHDVVRKVREVEPLLDTDEDSEDTVDAPYTPEHRKELPACELPDFNELYIREEFAQIAPLLRKVLNDRQRMILELHFQGGLNLREIASMIGYSRAYVHIAKQTALKKIRNRLIDRKQFFNKD